MRALLCGALLGLGVVAGCSTETATSDNSESRQGGGKAGGKAGSGGKSANWPSGSSGAGGSGAGGSGAAGGAAGSQGGSGGSESPFGGGGSDAAGSGQGGSAQGGSAQGGSGQGCGLTTNNAACDGCLDASCCSQETACSQNPQCVPLIQCVGQCGDQNCANACGAKYPSGVQAYNDLINCFTGPCGSACGAQGGSGGSGQGGSAAGGSTGGSDDDAQYCVDKINEYRATLGLPPYQRWYEAEKCSDGEAQSDSQTGQAHGAFGQCGEFAQNECPGWPGPIKSLLDGCLAQMWAEGPGADFQAHGHYINMSSTKYSRVACGFHQTTGGSLWAVQNFQLLPGSGPRVSRSRTPRTRGPGGR